MTQFAENVDFPLDASEITLILYEGLLQYFDGDILARGFVETGIYFSECTLPNSLLYLRKQLTYYVIVQGVGGAQQLQGLHND